MISMPKLTKKDKKPTAEDVINEKISKFADKAETEEEVIKVQRMIQNQVEIKSAKKIAPLGVPIEHWFTGALTITQIGIIVKAEEFRGLTSKAMNFVTKGRLR